MNGSTNLGDLVSTIVYGDIEDLEKSMEKLFDKVLKVIRMTKDFQTALNKDEDFKNLMNVVTKVLKDFDVTITPHKEPKVAVPISHSNTTSGDMDKVMDAFNWEGKTPVEFKEEKAGGEGEKQAGGDVPTPGHTAKGSSATREKVTNILAERGITVDSHPLGRDNIIPLVVEKQNYFEVVMNGVIKVKKNLEVGNEKQEKD